MTHQDFLTHLTQLNITLSPQQLTAVQAVEGPVLLLAVPGSGKTTVLVTRRQRTWRNGVGIFLAVSWLHGWSFAPLTEFAQR